MAKVSINIKADREVKVHAQQVAERMGMPLSVIINAYLSQFIRTKEVHFFLEGNLKTEARQRLTRLASEARNSKHRSPSFEHAREAIRFLHSK